ncbi:MAG: TIR domain-containing protein [Theionarchaea archaeon]|nr:TIR domain-containing protein [Theionarchaea archaeon]
MKKKKYLIYLDILGFEQLPREISEKTGFQEDVIRDKFLSMPLKEEVERINRSLIGSYRGESAIEGLNSYVLTFDDIQTAFEAIGKLTNIKIPHEDYRCIPLEIQLSTYGIDEDIKTEPIYRKEILEFLKNDIISPYRNYYREAFGKAIRSTFVLLTESAYSDLEPLEKKYSEEISYKKKTFLVMNLERIQQRCRIFDFLKKIGYPNSRVYGRIDEVYVPPIEYKEIAEMLNEKRIVFITGPSEFGKTYTAVRLMWEFYSKGYEPVWIKGGEQAERTIVRRRLEDIRAWIKPHNIIYFEDPFGRTRYERRESLEREIGNIIDGVRHTEDSYVIITSREGVFKEFEKEKLSKRSIREFERSLNLRTPSYDYEERKEILLRWAENEGCIWLENESLKNPVLASMRNIEILPTPLMIRSFALDTANLNRKDELEEKLKEKSEEMVIASSREIKCMSYDKILFLFFPFISSNFRVDFIKRVYEELLNELNLEGAWDFRRVVDWFKDDKINVGECIEFSHPLYSEALKYLLVENGYITSINRGIFSKLLFRLSEEDEAVGSVAFMIVDNYLMLPEDVRSLLFRLSEKDEAAGSIALAVAKNFDKLPENVRKLLFKIYQKENLAEYVASAVVKDFERLPEDVRIEILSELCERDEVSNYVTWAVAIYFDKIPEDMRNNLLLKLYQNKNAARYVAFAVARNFNKLPEDIQNLLPRLAEIDETAEFVAWAVGKDFNKLPENVRNSLLLKLHQKDHIAPYVELIITENFNILPDHIIRLLFNGVGKIKKKPSKSFKYDLAISFAGENREIAKELAAELQDKGVKIFYDEFYKSKLWGKKLRKHFKDIYGPKARFVVVLISEYYPMKDWTDFEFSVIKEEARKRENDFVLPIRLDETKIIGI